MPTFDEAKCCPKCAKPGEAKLERVIDRRANTRLYTVKCLNEGCRWFNTGWAVQVDGEGMVFERNRGPRGMDKSFPVMSPDQLAHGRAQVEDVLKRDAES